MSKSPARRAQPPVANIATLSTLTSTAGRRYRHVPVNIGDDTVTFIIASLTELERKTLLEDWVRDADGTIIPERQKLYSLRLLQLCLVDQDHKSLCEIGDANPLLKDELDEVDATALQTLQQVDSGVVQFLVSEIVDHTRIRKASVADAAKNSD